MTRSAEVFRLYANCVPVRGARRSLICDLQNHRAHFIPNDLYFMLTELSDLSAPEMSARCDASGETIEAYFDLLVEKDYGFWCDEPESFPALDLAWDRPEAITNAIIDVDSASEHDYVSIFSQLDGLGCQAVQVRGYDELSLAELEEIVKAGLHRHLRHVDFVIKYQPEMTEESLAQFCTRYQVVSRVVVYSSPRASKTVLKPLPILIRFYTQEMTPDSCGEVAPAYFSLTLEHFTESHHFNSCLNRKIAISADGHIKACPAMRQSFGRMGQVDLASAIKDPALVQLGSITKDQIEVCRDCEFRYVCTDCRAYTSQSGNLYSKPAKCSYDPYTATWARPGA